MKFYFAPLEGNTGYVYRNAHHALFGTGIAAYYSPFVVANYTKKLKTREKVDVLPENNAGVPLVPQILANDADIFLFTARAMADLGYREINLNLGCPVGTVVSKHKGSGMLQFPEELDRFLDGIFNGAAQQGLNLRISIKTRLGFNSVEEVPRIFAIYEQYPIAELIIHARTRQEQYSGQPELGVFRDILRHTKLPLCYNGNFAAVQDIHTLCRYLQTDVPVNCMIGRGLLASPGLVREILTGQKTTKNELKTFHQHLYKGYQAQYSAYHGQSSGATVVLNRMKEVWTHLGGSFDDQGRFLKAIHKARNLTEYETAVRLLFANCSVREPAPGLRIPEPSAATGSTVISTDTAGTGNTEQQVSFEEQSIHDGIIAAGEMPAGSCREE